MNKCTALIKVILVFNAFLCISCTGAAPSSVALALPFDAASSAEGNTQPVRYIPLKALNKNARSGVIAAPENSALLLFAFEKGPELYALIESGLYALELDFELQTTGSELAGPNQFVAGLLYTNDFAASGTPKKNIRPQYPVTAQQLPQGRFTLSIGFADIDMQSADICGFMVYSQVPLKLASTAIVPVRYGWIKNKDSYWYGLPAGGGSIPLELFSGAASSMRTTLLRPSLQTYSGNGGRDRFVIHFDTDLPVDLTTEKQPRLLFRCGNRQLAVYRSPQLYRLTLDGCLFSDVFLDIEQTNTETGLSGITVEYYTPSPLSPITADTGLIVNWPQEKWRQPSYELFAWEQFPSVLIFDFADYAVQDAYLKRLAFFAEKKGFVGKLMTDTQLHSFHGFNAHDYRAETLAAFFQKAEQERFPLNKSEIQLCDILFHNGIIVRTENGIEAGRGAIVSLSRQSPQSLRYRFITHECLHGIYFINEDFRKTVAEVFQQTDPRSVLFLRRYFEVTPTLNYNTADEYLLQNEFMAYILQQSSGYLQWYYLNRLSRQWAISKAEPKLCEYIRSTKAEPFMQAAARMSSFLYTRWGIVGGRVALIDLQSP